MSIKGDTYKDLSSLLKSELDGLKWIDLYKGQFQHLDDELPIPFPAVLIQFVQGNWQSKGHGLQEGQVMIRLHVGYENYADSFDGSLNQEKALEYFQFMEDVYTTLEGSSGQHYQNMTRVADGDDASEGAVIIEWIDFSCTIIDSSAYQARDTTVLESDPDILVQREDNLPTDNSPRPFSID